MLKSIEFDLKIQKKLAIDLPNFCTSRQKKPSQKSIFLDHHAHIATSLNGAVLA
jgi:hypothetical protein